MQKVSMRKLSLLGLVLLAASAVTSAFTSAKDDKRNGNNDGSLRANSVTGDAAANVISCITEQAVEEDSCTASTNGGATNTSAAMAASSVTAGGGQTVGNAGNPGDNTSQTAGISGDQTSFVQRPE